MDPEPHAHKLRNGFFAHAGVAEEEKQGSIRRTRLGLLVLNFVPSWFSVNMGTGIISLLLYTLPHTFTGLQDIAMGFYVLNLLLFVIFVGLSIARYTMHPWLVYRMLRNPTISMFLGTIPMALCTIINGTVLIAGPRFGSWVATLVFTLWWIDVALTVASSFAIPLLMFHIHELALETMTAVWLLPIVPCVVASASGGVVATILTPSWAIGVILVSYMLWGVGMGLALILLTLYFHRLAVHNLPTAEVIVSAFLPLGPLGQGAYAIMQLAKVGKEVFPATDFAGERIAASDVFVVSVVIALMMWGLGLWWLVHGISCVTIRFLSHGMHFNMGFWGFIFPLGVFTAATMALAEDIPSVILSWLAVVFVIALVCMWFGVVYGTAVNAWNGKLFVAPCLNTGPSKPQRLNLIHSAPCQSTISAIV
ncbi:hypothetical protein CVIRNUC_001807 [Coccomyxa viridis]|uniref:C4-dicarboxylate transporter/malic acid transport protein n=1 Tax=Coccomyxa viridis TaxID=1274662 RepID=A0AAV1HU67_9CHLO|nr:hypothetical protein CVIRNUC_001807 [Coccomyxa viridis]